MKNETTPAAILHIPDLYENSGGKWKDRYMANPATMAAGLIRYLRWPGDTGRPGRGEPATELGLFNVYRYDAEATAKLRKAMEEMPPRERFDYSNKREVSWGGRTQTIADKRVNKQFARRLRLAIESLTGAKP